MLPTRKNMENDIIAERDVCGRPILLLPEIMDLIQLLSILRFFRLA